MKPDPPPPTFLPLPAKYADPHRRNNPHYGSNLLKRVYLADRLSVTAEDVPDLIDVPGIHYAPKQAFADQLPQSICYQGRQGLNEAFKKWLAEEKNSK